MNEAISLHLAQQMGLTAHIAEDGKCYITIAGADYHWCLFGSSPYSDGQIGYRFKPWASGEGLSDDPVLAAQATGFIG